MPFLSPPEALRELELRSVARASIADYVEYMDLGVTPAQHHRLILRHLEAVEVGKIDKLMICEPPGSGKSFYCSMVFPSWYLGRNPTKAILACSHTQDLADRFGRRVRNLFSRPDHAALFGVSIARDSKAVSYWSTELDGEYFAAGVGVAITGRRADIGLIDDPTKGREEADSLRAQERTYDWYISDFLTRLKPKAAQIIVTTRWHERDLAGRILDREADQWTVVELGMEAHVDDPLGRRPGVLLWPEWFTPKMVEVAKLDARSWQALYQQRPVSEEGDYFKASWFGEYDALPANTIAYGASDYAVTEGHGDFTEHGIFNLDSMGNIYITDWWRGQTTPDIWIEKQCDLILDHDPELWFGESGPIRRSVEPFLTARMTERNAECRIEWLPSINDKPTRCKSFQAKASMGKVFLPKNARWKGDLLHQLTSFPSGRHDDGVDVCSLIGRGLQMVRTPKLRRFVRSTSIESNVSDLSWMVH